MNSQSPSDDLDAAIVQFIRQEEARAGEQAFNALALQIFAYQCHNNTVYRKFCEQRDATPSSVQRWQDIPAVPTDAFKSLDFRCFPAEKTIRTFVSSGTTRAARSRHHLDTLALYQASLLPNFERHLLPDNSRLPMLALTPSSESHPESSLIAMVETVMRNLAAPGSRYFLAPDGRFLSEEFIAALRLWQERGQPVLLLGTAFSFVHFLEWCESSGDHFRLPPGSRIMETGGYKGRSREIPRPELVAWLEDRLGIPSTHCVNEYGMTELGVQFYDWALRDLLSGRPPRPGKSVPHWARVQALDPETMRPAVSGDTGVLQICDLSNRGSCIQILTGDLGRCLQNGFEVLGRASGSEARGCSLTLEEILRLGGQ